MMIVKHIFQLKEYDKYCTTVDICMLRTFIIIHGRVLEQCL